jgi:Flp pilus assembly protein TadG
VEFALVLPLFLILLFGVVEFGLIMYAKGVVTQASREGARYGVVYSLTPRTPAEIKAHVEEYLREMGFSGATVPDPVTDSTSVSVKVIYPYQFTVLPSFIAGLTGSISLSAETTMLKE